MLSGETAGGGGKGKTHARWGLGIPLVHGSVCAEWLCDYLAISARAYSTAVFRALEVIVAPETASTALRSS